MNKDEIQNSMNHMNELQRKRLGKRKRVYHTIIGLNDETRYGQKGGDSPNAGLKATVYEATLPDGTKVRKRSFKYTTEEAFIGAYLFEGKWYAAGVTNKTQDGYPMYDNHRAKSQVAIDAKKVK